MGRSIGRKLCYVDKERESGDVLFRQAVVEGWIGGEAIDWVGRNVDAKFDVAGG